MSEKEKMTGYPSIDQPWLKYYTEEDLKIKVPECTIYKNIYDRNKDYPEDIAILYYGNKIRYRELFTEVEACAKTLRAIGIKRGECVNLCTAGVPEAIYVVLACSRVGAIANFINPLFSIEQMIDRINDTEAEWILVLDAMYGYIKDALPKTCIKRVVIIPATNSVPPMVSKLLYLKSDARKILKNKSYGNQEYLSWKEFRGIGSSYKDAVDVPYERDTAAVMVYSSGSTGASKGILLTNDGILATNYYRNLPPDPVDRQKTFLQMIPIWFSTGIVISIMIPLINGCSVILEAKFSKELFAKDLIKYKPNMTLAATSLWLYEVSLRYKENVNLSFMECPITGGEKISGEDEKAINSFLKNNGCLTDIFKGYGMCELGGTVTSTSNAVGYRGKDCGAGYPIHGVIVSAFDMDTDDELSYGKYGEIRVCSPARMKGYYKNPEATADFFKIDSQGQIWGCTGDIGYVDEDGEVFICGRATDSATLKTGERIYLFDIEDVIFEDESVVQCKVVDINTPDGTELAAHIVFKEGTDDLDTALHRIHNLLLVKLQASQVPKYYKSRSSMPVHSNGKRDVEALRKETDGFIVYQ